LRFLETLGVVDPAFIARWPVPPKPAQQRMIEVTDAITITADRFSFVDNYLGLEVIPKRGTLIAHDGVKPLTTPYDDCVLIMPSRRLTKGQTAVRLGRYIG
jgi:hypothetical protein